MILSGVESRTGAVATLKSLRLPSPLIKPDVRISRIRLSDRLHRPAHGDTRGRLRLAIQLPRKSSDPVGVVRLIANHLSSTSSKAHLKQGPFPPPALPGFLSTTTLSDSHRRAPPLPQLTRRWVSHVARITFPTCRAHYPGGSNGCSCRSPSPSVMPSPVSAGRHPQLHFRGLLRLYSRYGPSDRSTAFTRPLSRGFDVASCPTTPLVSFRSHRLFSGWNPPPQVIRALVAHRDARGPQ
jgi:hypothetical protein